MSDSGFRVSPQQQRLLASNLAHLPAHARFAVPGLEAALLQQALARLVERHEILRTRFLRPPGLTSFLQVIEPQLAVSLLPLLPSQQPEPPFDLAQAPLFRFRFGQDEQARPLLVIAVANAIGDRRSLSLWARQLAELCRDLSLGRLDQAESEAEPALQFLQFSEWWNDAATNVEDQALAANARELWRGASAALPLELPFPLAPDASPTSLSFSLPAPPLLRRCQARGLALESLCFSAWQALLYRLADQPQLPLFWSIDARKYEDLAELAGPLSESLPCARAVDGRQSLDALWAANQAAHQATLDWLEYYQQPSAETAPVRLDFAFQPEIEPLPGPFQWVPLERHADQLGAALSLSCALRAEQLQLTLSARGPERAQLQELAAQLRAVLDADFALPIERLDLRSPEERAFWRDFQETPPAPAGDLLASFRLVARRQPDQKALVCVDGALSYGALDRASDRLALALRARGVGLDQLVALRAERRRETLVALLALWKVGAAYVPLDPKTPPAKLAQILDQLDCRLWLSADPADCHDRVERLDPACAFALPEPAAPVAETALPPQRLAYAIMTSGSTGTPKAVLVEHRNLANYVAAACTRLELSAGVYGHLSALFADLGHTMLFPALAQGGCLRLFSAQALLDPQALLDELRELPLDYLKIAPTHLASLLAAELSAVLPRSGLVLGGEAAPAGLLESVRRLAPQCRIYNHYGPTETTVGVLATALEPEAARAPLGRPLAGVRIVLHNRAGAPVPRGVLGEIWVGGEAVGRGYHRQAALTAAVFVPGADGTRYYRTGDLARLDASGRLLFAGRRDHQLKIRGYRVEPGEIEAVLRAAPGVADSAVLALQREGGAGLVLVAYVAAAAGAAIKSALETHLAERLPDYMRPHHLVFLAALPYTANGKLARASLPPLKQLAPERAYRPPQTAVEQVLCQAWAEVLGAARVGLDDNYFELGGDSITSIQIMSRARRHGVALEPKLIFEYPTVARLAAHCASVQAEAPAALERELEPGPIQQWFFGLGLSQAHHWNMSVFLDVRQPLVPDRLARAVTALVAHHPGLRLTFDAAGVGHYLPAGLCPFRQCDLSSGTESERRQRLERETAAAQGGLNLQTGPLFQVVLYDLGDLGQRLLLLAHHLLVDGVSWRILMDDLATAYAALTAGQAPDFGAPTHSAATWLRACRAWAQTPSARAEAEYWLSSAAAPDPLRALAPGPGREGESRSLDFALETDQTQALTQRLSSRVQLVEALVYGLAEALAQGSRSDCVQLGLEGHGRESLEPTSCDLSRTVGWFTSHYPVALRLPAGPPAERLAALAAQLRAVPNKGVGFGILRAFGPADLRRDLAGLRAPQVRFNYLGRIAQDGQTAQLFAPASESPGPQRHPDDRRAVDLAVNAYVRDERLQVRFDFDPAVLAEADIAALAASCRAHLLALLDAELAPAAALAPESFPEAQLDRPALVRALQCLAELRGLTQTALLDQLEDLYRLSPIQQGILFHSLLPAEAGLFFRQMSWSMDQALDGPAFLRAWTQVAQNHAAMRTAFFLTESGQPLQAVFRQVDWDVRLLDWRERPPQLLEQDFQQLRLSERERGFDLAVAPLFRLVLIQTGEHHWRVVWSYHHLILDGWSKYLFLKQVLQAYGERRVPAAEPVSFRDYIRWLRLRDLERARAFWQRFLHRAPVKSSTRAAAAAVFEHERFRLDPALFEQLGQLARARGLTLNSLVQLAWAATLAHLERADEVLYGTTVSGRPADLPGVETIVGPFIDTLPVRCRLEREQALTELALRLQADLLDINRYAGHTLVELRQLAELPGSGPLFDSLVVFYNYPVDQVVHRNRANLGVADLQFIEEDNFPLGLSARVDGTLCFDLRWDRSAHSASWVQRAAALVLQFFAFLIEHPDADRAQLERSFEQCLEALAAQEKHNFKQQRFTRRAPAN